MKKSTRNALIVAVVILALLILLYLLWGRKYLEDKKRKESFREQDNELFGEPNNEWDKGPSFETPYPNEEEDGDVAGQGTTSVLYPDNEGQSEPIPMPWYPNFVLPTRPTPVTENTGGEGRLTTPDDRSGGDTGGVSVLPGLTSSPTAWEPPQTPVLSPTKPVVVNTPNLTTFNTSPWHVE